MSKAVKSPIIEFPSQLVLNEHGESYFFGMGVPLKTVNGINGRKKMGFRAQNIEVPFIKTLLAQNFFEEIYSQSLTFIDKKANIQDITKLIFYNVIYTKFKPHVTEVLLSSDLVERFNHKNPTKKITHDTQFNEQKIKAFFQERKNTITKLINNILQGPFEVIDKDQDMQEKEEKKRIMKTFLQHISLKEWFLFFLVTNSQEERDRVTQRLSDLMITYLGKTKIADYLSFLAIELIQNAEKASLERVVRLKKLAEDDPESYLKEARNRDIAKEFAKQMGYYIELSWKIKVLETNSSIHTKRLEVKVSNRGVIPRSDRQSVKNKSQVNVKARSLASFYEENSGGMGAGLGLFYISYLNEESKKHGVRFDSLVESDDERDQTFATLKVTI